jgi:hypothetical protein
MAKVVLQIEVEVESTGKDPKAEDFTFLNLKVVGAEGQSIPLPPDAPCPRRFVKDLALAAGRQILAAKTKA